jgi:hypothetical protein
MLGAASATDASSRVRVTGQDNYSIFGAHSELLTVTLTTAQLQPQYFQAVNVPSPAPVGNGGIIYVNRKQYHRILKRREARALLEQKRMVLVSRKVSAVSMKPTSLVMLLFSSTIMSRNSGTYSNAHGVLRGSYALRSGPIVRWCLRALGTWRWQ